MHYEVLLGWLAGVFGLLALLVTGSAVVAGPGALFVAAPMAGMAVLLWYHASGRLERRLRGQARRRTAQRRAADGGQRRAPTGGPRGPGGPRAGPAGRGRAAAAGPGQRTDAERRQWGSRRGARRGRRTGAGAGAVTAGMAPSRARSILGVDAEADASTIRAAYLERVKETHPDAGGDEDAFKRVTEAYDALGEPG